MFHVNHLICNPTDPDLYQLMVQVGRQYEHSHPFKSDAERFQYGSTEFIKRAIGGIKGFVIPLARRSPSIPNFSVHRVRSIHELSDLMKDLQLIDSPEEAGTIAATLEKSDVYFDEYDHFRTTRVTSPSGSETYEFVYFHESPSDDD